MVQPSQYSRSPRNVSTEKVYGLSACLAVMQARPEDVQRIAHTEQVRREVGPILKEAARRRISYEERSADELALIADAQHHEGICMYVVPRRVTDLYDFLEQHTGPLKLLALDGVSNPHNIGALVRSAAFFAYEAVLIERTTRGPLLTPAAVRIAEGGAERVEVLSCDSLPDGIAALRRAHVTAIGADAHAKAEIASIAIPPRLALVLGAERTGLRPDTRRALTSLVAIRGVGDFDSLNVSVAGGILLAKFAGAI